MAAQKATMNSVDWRTMWGTASSDDLDEVAAYDAVAWVKRCLEIRCNALSSIPVHVYRNSKEIEWEFAALMPKFLWLTEAALQLYGAAYWERQRNRFVDKGYKWLLPTSITPRYTEAEGLVSFERQLATRTITLMPKDVLYFWTANLAAELGPGKGWVSTVLTESEISHYANKFAAGFFERGAIPAVLLSVEGNPAASELTRLETWWRRMLQGTKHAWETVAVKASVKPQVIGFPMGDLAMPELMNVVRQQIAVAAGVPQTMLEDAANYATASEQRRSFYDETVIPEALVIAGALNDQLFGPMGLKVVLDHQELDIYQADESERSASLQQLTSAGVPLDMAMEMLGFELPGEMTYDQLRERIKEEAEERAARAPQFTQPAQEEDEPDEREAEMRQWRRFASKRTGEEAAKFKCHVIDDATAQVIRARLKRAITGEEVKAAFDKVQPEDAELLDVPETIKITEEDIARAFAEWDRLMPSEFRGLLDAGVETNA